jgi:DNA-binding MarR family transcriptional regulator
MGLLLADRLRDAAEDAGAPGAIPAGLVTLTHHDGTLIDELAGALRVSHSRAVRVVDALEAAGLAGRHPHPDDGRAVHVRLTTSGRRAAQRVLRARAGALEEALAGLARDERVELARIASKILAQAGTSRRAFAICRLCNSRACGHLEGHCPVTQAVRSATYAQP